RRTAIMPADLPTLQRSPMPRQRLSSTDVTEYRIGTAASVCLDVGRADHLGPFFGVCRDEARKLSRRSGENRITPVGDARLNRRTASPALTALWSLSITSTGVLRGAPIPCQPLARSSDCFRMTAWGQRR